MAEIASKNQLRLSFLRWAAVVVPLILFLGFLSSRIVPGGARNAWYAALAKPAMTPPDWSFPVVWGVLYVLTGLALAIVLHARGARLRGVAVASFVAQFVIGLAWTPLFFGAHLVFWALAVLGVMLVLAIATTLLFARIRAVAALLMLPYLAWLCFAGLLTWQIMTLNPHAETLEHSGPSAQIDI